MSVISRPRYSKDLVFTCKLCDKTFPNKVIAYTNRHYLTNLDFWCVTLVCEDHL